jgi:hypothetical protein
MVRTTIKSNSGVVPIHIPSKYIGRELAVNICHKFEGIESISNEKKKVSFNALSIDTLHFKFNREEANER